MKPRWHCQKSGHTYKVYCVVVVPDDTRVAWYKITEHDMRFRGLPDCLGRAIEDLNRYMETRR